MAVDWFGDARTSNAVELEMGRLECRSSGPIVNDLAAVGHTNSMDLEARKDSGLNDTVHGHYVHLRSGKLVVDCIHFARCDFPVDTGYMIVSSCLDDTKMVVGVRHGVEEAALQDLATSIPRKGFVVEACDWSSRTMIGECCGVELLLIFIECAVEANSGPLLADGSVSAGGGTADSSDSAVRSSRAAMDTLTIVRVASVMARVFSCTTAIITNIRSMATTNSLVRSGRSSRMSSRSIRK